jgi:glycine/D-amino acid oxidase-like deaminating enzyme
MPERDQLEVDVLIVGGGPAGLAAAIKLRQLAKERGKDDLSVMLIDKGGDIGSHGISGAVVDPKRPRRTDSRAGANERRSSRPWPPTRCGISPRGGKIGVPAARCRR